MNGTNFNHHHQQHHRNQIKIKIKPTFDFYILLESIILFLIFNLICSLQFIYFDDLIPILNGISSGIMDNFLFVFELIFQICIVLKVEAF